MTKELVDIDAMARRLKVSVSTIRAWVHRGVIPPKLYVSVGTIYRFDADAIIDHLLSAGSESTVADAEIEKEE